MSSPPQRLTAQIRKTQPQTAPIQGRLREAGVHGHARHEGAELGEGRGHGRPWVGGREQKGAPHRDGGRVDAPRQGGPQRHQAGCQGGPWQGQQARLRPGEGQGGRRVEAEQERQAGHGVRERGPPNFLI